MGIDIMAPVRGLQRVVKAALGKSRGRRSGKRRKGGRRRKG